jgi:hypothetical protein
VQRLRGHHAWRFDTIGTPDPRAVHADDGRVFIVVNGVYDKFKAGSKIVR